MVLSVKTHTHLVAALGGGGGISLEVDRDLAGVPHLAGFTHTWRSGAGSRGAYLCSLATRVTWRSMKAYSRQAPGDNGLLAVSWVVLMTELAGTSGEVEGGLVAATLRA